MEPHVTRLRLRVSPGSHRAGVVGRYGDGWKVRVAAAPEHGRANDELVRLLSRKLGVARDEVQVVAGTGSRDKLVQLQGITADEADRLLAAAGEERE